MFARSRYGPIFASMFQYLFLFAIVCVIVAPTHVFAGQRHERRKAARLARHQSKHTSSGTVTSSSHTEIHRHQSR